MSTIKLPLYNGTQYNNLSAPFQTRDEPIRKIPDKPASNNIAALNQLKDMQSESQTTNKTSNHQEVKSWLDTEVDGALNVDEKGNCLADRMAFELFQYFFVATGELNDDEIISEIKLYIEQNLKPKAASQAKTFLYQFLQYRLDALQTYLDTGNSNDFKERFVVLQALRRKAFGNELAQKLFGEEEYVSSLTLKRFDISGDTSLSPDEKNAKLSEMIQQLPPRHQTVWKKTQAPHQLASRVRDLRKTGSTDQDIWKVRAEEYNEATADRLSQLDDKRSVWKQKVNAYREKKNIILSDTVLNENEKDEKIRQLQATSFSVPELKRLQALEKISAQN